jgi:hypothetical protein
MQRQWLTNDVHARQARSKGELPRLYSAVVHADLNLGPIRRLLFWVRAWPPLPSLSLMLGFAVPLAQPPQHAQVGADKDGLAT